MPTAVRTSTSLGATGTSAAEAGGAGASGVGERPTSVVTLPASARVDDAIAAAGGADVDADLDALNLAAPVVDGSRIYVPRR